MDGKSLPETPVLPAGAVANFVAIGALESVVDAAAAQLYENYLDAKVVPFAVGLAVEQLFDAVARATAAPDAQVAAGSGGDGTATSEQAAAAPPAPADAPDCFGSWTCEAEPAPLEIDAAARGAVSTRPAAHGASGSSAGSPSRKRPLLKSVFPAQAPPASVSQGGAPGADVHGELRSPEDGTGAPFGAHRPGSPTEADTLFLQRELAIPERPSSVADGSRRPEPRDGPEQRLRRAVLARERAKRDRDESREREQRREMELEHAMIKQATGAVSGKRFTMHDDGTILPVAAGAKRGKGRRPASSGTEVRPAVRLRDEGSLEVDPDTQHLLDQTTKGRRPQFLSRTGPQAAFGGRAAREQKLADTLSRARAKEARAADRLAGSGPGGPDELLDHPSSEAARAGKHRAGSAVGGGVAPVASDDDDDDDAFFTKGVEEQPSLVDALGEQGVAPGAVLREQGRGEVGGAPHPRQAASAGRRSRNRRRQDQHTAGELSSALPAVRASASSVPEPGAGAPAGPKAGRLDTEEASRDRPAAGRQHAGPSTPVSVRKPPPSDAGFRKSPSATAGRVAARAGGAVRAAAPAEASRTAALPAVRERRGRGGFAPSPAKQAPPIAVRTQQAPPSRGKSPKRAAQELAAAFGATNPRFPRERLLKQAKPNPAEHQPPPAWPGTSRFDPRAGAGALGPAGVTEVKDDEDLAALPSDGHAGSSLRRTSGHTSGTREWGESAARRAGGSLIMGSGED